MSSSPRRRHVVISSCPNAGIALSAATVGIEVRLKDVDAAQMAMVQVAKDLAAKGEIMLAGQGGEDELIY